MVNAHDVRFEHGVYLSNGRVEVRWKCHDCAVLAGSDPDDLDDMTGWIGFGCFLSEEEAATEHDEYARLTGEIAAWYDRNEQRCARDPSEFPVANA